MAVPKVVTAALIAVTIGVIACFVRVGTLQPPYDNLDPPAFDAAACAACTAANNSTCANVFKLGGAPDFNEARVCSTVGVTCCCPHRDPTYLSVRCIESYTANPTATTCQCRFERLCGESCSLNEGLVPLILGIAGCFVIFCLSIGAFCCHCSPRRQAPPKPMQI